LVGELGDVDARARAGDDHPFQGAHRGERLPAGHRDRRQADAGELPDKPVQVSIAEGPAVAHGQRAHAARWAGVVALGRQLELDPQRPVRHRCGGQAGAGEPGLDPVETGRCLADDPSARQITQ
jgi:hypothetical protein